PEGVKVHVEWRKAAVKKEMSMKTKAVIACLLVFGLVALVLVLRTDGRSASTISYTQFLDQVRTRSVARATIISRDSGATPAICELENGSKMQTVLPRDYRDALAQMQEYGVNIEMRDAASGVGGLLLNSAPFLVMLAVWIVLMIRGVPIIRGQL